MNVLIILKNGKNQYNKLISFLHNKFHSWYDLDDVDIAINLLLYVVKKQVFLDGNKRTSVIFVNHYLISKGKGLIVIPVEKVKEYKNLLIDFYESNNKEKIFKFIKDNCYLPLGNI